MVRVSALDLLRDEILDGLVDFGDQLSVSFTLLIFSSSASLHFPRFCLIFEARDDHNSALVVPLECLSVSMCAVPCS